jgi:molybdopterin-guanine dinucleotide biosynthesis protein A
MGHCLGAAPEDGQGRAAYHRRMSTDASPPSGAVAGLIVAGGRSTRFGGEKAVALLDSRPLLVWAAQRLQRSCGLVAVNARPDTETEALARAVGLEVLHDAPGDPDGPLAGVRAGLAWAKSIGAQSLAVSPCDAPLLPQDLFDRLIEAAGEGAAMAVTSDGRQPLCAIWPVSALEVLTQALAGGAHPPTWRTLEGLGAAQVSFDPPEAFANVNTKEDLAELTVRWRG